MKPIATLSLCLAVLTCLSACQPSEAKSTLNKGEVLRDGQSLTSPNGKNVAQMQDGNLVEIMNGKQVWASFTATIGDTLEMREDGNLVINAKAAYQGYRSWFWASNTTNQGEFFTIQDDGNMVVYDANGKALWSLEALRRGQSLPMFGYLKSNDGRFTAAMTYDGTFAVREGDKVLWSVPSWLGAYVRLLDDGNLVIVDYSDAVIWQAGTAGKGGVILSMQADGDLVLKDASGNPVWSTNTKQ